MMLSPDMSALKYCSEFVSIKIFQCGYRKHQYNLNVIVLILQHSLNISAGLELQTRLTAAL